MTPPLVPKPGMTKKSMAFRIVLFGITVAVLAGVAMIVVVVVMVARFVNGMSDNTQDNLAKVQIGMTSAQVIGIMGDTYRRERELDGSTQWLWPILEGTGTVVVTFQSDNVVKTATDLHRSIVGETISYPAVGEGGFLLPCKVVREETPHTFLIRSPGGGKLLLVKSTDDVAIGATFEAGRVRITGSTQVNNPDGDGQATALIADDTPLPPTTSPGVP